MLTRPRSSAPSRDFIPRLVRRLAVSTRSTLECCHRTPFVRLSMKRRCARKIAPWQLEQKHKIPIMPTASLALDGP